MAICAQRILSVLHIESAASAHPAVLLSLLALPQHTLRCFSACLAGCGAFQPASDGKESGVEKTYWHGKERPGHSDECNYSIALLIPPDLVVPSLALARVLWLELSRTSWDVLGVSRYAFPFETFRRRPARAN